MRHGGRYGGSLSERGTNPVLKKASTPSVATVSKETQLSNGTSNTVAAAVENELNNNMNSTKTTTFRTNTTNSLIGSDSGTGIVSGYETDTGINFAYKRSIDHQNSNTMKYNDDTKINNNVRAVQPTPTVYSIDASYQTLSKNTQHQHQIQLLQQQQLQQQQQQQLQHQHQQNQHKIQQQQQQPPPPSQLKQYQYSQIQQPQPPALPVKQHQHQHQSQPPASMGLSNVSIINQPLPDIPQQAHSHSQRNPQPLSASNLGKRMANESFDEQYRSKPIIRSEFDSNSLKYSHNTRTRTAQTRPTSQAHTQTLKHSSTSMATNVPMSMVQPPPLPQKADQPPMLPPKNKNKSDHHANKSSLKQNQKSHQTHSGVSAPPPQKVIKPTEHVRYMGVQQQHHQQNQHQPTSYSTFGHDYTRENRRYARENVRESAPKSSSYSREYHAEPAKSSSRHQATSTGTSTTTPHRSARDHSHGMIDAGRMSDCQFPYDASQHRQYSQHADHHGTYPHRSRMADESHHTYRTTETNRRNYSRDRGDSSDLTGNA